MNNFIFYLPNSLFFFFTSLLCFSGFPLIFFSLLCFFFLGLKTEKTQTQKINAVGKIKLKIKEKSHTNKRKTELCIVVVAVCTHNKKPKKMVLDALCFLLMWKKKQFVKMRKTFFFVGQYLYLFWFSFNCVRRFYLQCVGWLVGWLYVYTRRKNSVTREEKYINFNW